MKEELVENVNRAFLLPSGLKQLDRYVIEEGYNIEEELPVLDLHSDYIFLDEQTGDGINCGRSWTYFKELPRKHTLIHHVNSASVGTYNGLLSMTEHPIIIQEILDEDAF